MKVLSLFDGMAAGALAMQAAGIEFENYDAFEIDKYAVQTPTHNFPFIKHHGDVFEADFTEFKGYDYLVGGSPCTYWSIAQKNNRETEASGLGWELFSQYVRALREAQPKFFIYENNKSMAKAIKASITETFGFEPILINSALVSAQNRQRLYWVGRRNEDGTYSKVSIEQPEDRGILLKDILESGEPFRNEKAYCLDANYFKGGNVTSFNKQSGQRLQVAEPVCVAQRGRYADSGNRAVKGNGPIEQFYEARDDSKTNALTTVQKDNAIAEPVCLRYERTEEAKKLRKQYENHEIHHGFNEFRTLQPREDGKSNTVSTVQKDNMIAETVRVGSLPRPNGELSQSQAFRIYSTDGKSVNINAGGGGAGGKTGLYAMPIETAELSNEYYHGNEETSVFGKIECKNTSDNNGQPAQGTRVYNTNTKSICLDGYSRKYIVDTYSSSYIDKKGKPIPIYEVKQGLITIKGKQYKIKLADGFYIIRKLTVRECMRLQTVPEWYDFPVSDTQAYKMLGNGWTVDVIAHLIYYTKGGEE